MKYYKFAAASGVFFVLLLGIYYVHISFLRVDVLLYSAVLDAVLAALLSAGIFSHMHSFAIFNQFEKIQMYIIWMLIGYVLAISFPTIIDRSLSFYMLEKIAQRGGGIQFERFEEVFTKEYAKEHRLVDIRLTEQQESGTVRIEGGCVKLTERGRHLAAFSRFFRENLLPKHRLLMGNYTDELTDPFRKSAATADYGCQ